MVGIQELWIERSAVENSDRPKTDIITHYQHNIAITSGSDYVVKNSKRLCEYVWLVNTVARKSCVSVADGNQT